MGSEASIPVRVPAPAGASPEPAALASAAHALCDAGRTMEAETIARWLIHQHPQFSGARIVLGRVLFEQDRLNEAADVLRATTIQYPASVAAYRWLAEVLVRQGLWARARAVLNQAALLSPANRRINQLQRLAGQAAERGDVAVEDSTTRAMNLGQKQPNPPLPPIPAQALSRRERRNGLSEDDPTPAGVKPPETPLYARPDFVPKAPEPTPAPEEDPQPRRSTLSWPAAGAATPAELVPPYRESAVINLLAAPLRNEVALLEKTPSVTWKGIPMLDQHWRRRWRHGAALAAALVTTATVGGLAGWWALRPRAAEVSPKPSSGQAAAQRAAVPTALTDALALATPASLLEAIERARALPAPQGAVMSELARGLLLMDYGLTSAPEAPAGLPDRLDAGLADAATAAQAFVALAHGRLEQARALVQGTAVLDADAPWIPLAQARLLSRLGNFDAARERLAQAPREAAVVALLAAEVALDDGRPSEALAALAPLLTQGSVHPRAALLAAEARDALSTGETPPEACATDQPANLALACATQQASQARQAGQRAQAVARLLEAPIEPVSDPRAIGRAIVALENLGQSAHAKPLWDKLERLTAPAHPARGWADLARAMSAGPQVAGVPAPGAPPSAETRLLAARAAYARGGARALASLLDEIGAPAIKADDDLRWWRLLTRYDGASAMKMSVKLMRAKKPLGPVGTFVAGLLSADSRKLTSHWMSQALAAGAHGDRCWAAARFAQAQRNLGVDPYRLPAFRALMASRACANRS